MSTVHDLTHTIQEGMTTYPADRHPRTEITQLGRIHQEGSQTHRITLGTHTGTHVDAPSHFWPTAPGVASLSLDVLCGRALLVDCSSSRPDEVLDHTAPKRLVCRFGWSGRFSGGGFYDAHPTLPLGLAETLADSGVKLIGMDTPSPEPKGSSEVHRLLLDRRVILVEYMHLDALEPGWFDLYCLPLKVAGVDGAPARVVGVQ